MHPPEAGTIVVQYSNREKTGKTPDMTVVWEVLILRVSKSILFSKGIDFAQAVV